MLGQHRVDPGGRGAAIGQLLDDLREQAEPSLPAAEAPKARLNAQGQTIGKLINIVA